ncbi:hypothetical protein D782_3044 [Enterobacteriaceae bacterium strain FGI 57]|nr:hypothetical protein D782_3044 [Enterobacteriaceae bacterium strain FGI 57]
MNKLITFLSIIGVSIDSVLSISWNGFYDIKKKQYVWKNEPDFVVAIENRQNIKMKKCNFN